MIGWLNGKIIDKNFPNKIVIDVSGVGYDVEVSSMVYVELDLQSILGFHIHTIVREDALLLFGFPSKEERAFFRALIKVNGIGPKAGMSILSSISLNDFMQSIQQQDTSRLTKLPGIGKKTAERLVIEMKDSLDDLMLAHSISPHYQSNDKRESFEAISALVALGYKENEAKRAINKIANQDKSLELLIKEALQLMSSELILR